MGSCGPSGHLRLLRPLGRDAFASLDVSTTLVAPTEHFHPGETADTGALDDREGAVSAVPWLADACHADERESEVRDLVK